MAAVHYREECAAWDAETPTPPVGTRYLVNEATIEKVQVILKENPHGVLYLRDELSGWMAQLDQRGRERDRAFFLETWDGDGEFAFDRLGRGMVHASHLWLSVFGGLQPARLRRYLTDAVTGGAGDDGFMQRFQLLVWPDVQPNWEEIDRLPDNRAEVHVEQILYRLLQISPEDPVSGALQCGGARTVQCQAERVGAEDPRRPSREPAWSPTWPNREACCPSWR